MDNILETDKLKYIEFNKGYVEGSNQFKIFISDSAPITNVPIENYWQSHIVYNITIDKIYQFLENVNNSKPHLKDDPILDTIIYGKDGLVDKLKPYQNKYNTIKNKMYDYIRRCSEAMVIVEDGSIDVDSLEEEGLAPGKILVYRQGAQQPSTLRVDTVSETFLQQQEESVMRDFQAIINAFMSKMELKYGVVTQ